MNGGGRIEVAVVVILPDSGSRERAASVGGNAEEFPPRKLRHAAIPAVCRSSPHHQQPAIGQFGDLRFHQSPGRAVRRDFDSRSRRPVVVLSVGIPAPQEQDRSRAPGALVVLWIARRVAVGQGVDQCPVFANQKVVAEVSFVVVEKGCLSGVARIKGCPVFVTKLLRLAPTAALVARVTRVAEAVVQSTDDDLPEPGLHQRLRPGHTPGNLPPPRR